MSCKLLERIYSLSDWITVSIISNLINSDGSSFCYNGHRIPPYSVLCRVCLTRNLQYWKDIPFQNTKYFTFSRWVFSFINLIDTSDRLQRYYLIGCRWGQHFEPLPFEQNYLSLYSKKKKNSPSSRVDRCVLQIIRVKLSTVWLNFYSPSFGIW